MSENDILQQRRSRPRTPARWQPLDVAAGVIGRRWRSAWSFAVGCARSIWCARRRRVISSLGRPQSWTARGRPAGSSPTGTVAAGWPITFQGIAQAPWFEARSERRRPSAGRSRSNGGASAAIGVRATSAWSKISLIIAAVRASRRRGGEHGSGGDQSPEPGETAGARLEPVGVRQLGDVVADAGEVADAHVGHRPPAVAQLTLEHVVTERRRAARPSARRRRAARC